MKDWLKFFGLSFFSDKIAKDAKKRSLLNFFLGLLFALVFIFCGILGATCAPFKTHYKNSEEFKALVRNTVSKVSLTANNSLISADTVVNTFNNEADAENYKTGNYNLIIDTRPADTLDDFKAYCELKNGESEISYESWLNLSEDARKNYNFKIRYTDNALSLTDGRIEEYKNYLSAQTGEIKNEYDGLIGNQAQYTQEQLNRKIYSLYLKTYYAPVSAFKREDSAPLLRSFYYNEYLSKTENTKYLAVFDDLAFANFVTDGGVTVALYGSYSYLSDGVIGADGGDKLIACVYKSFVKLSASVYAYNVFRFVPMFAVIPLLSAVALKIAMKAFKNEEYNKYVTCLKIAGSFTFFAALLTALAMLVCGFFASGNILNLIPIAVYGGIMVIRTAVFIVCEKMRLKKSAENDNQNQQ